MISEGGRRVRAEDEYGRASCQAAADMRGHRANRAIMRAHTDIDKAGKERRRRGHRRWMREVVVIECRS